MSAAVDQSTTIEFIREARRTGKLNEAQKRLYREWLEAQPGTYEAEHWEAAIFLNISAGRLYNLATDGNGPRRIDERGWVNKYLMSDLRAFKKQGRRIIDAYSKA